MPNKDIQKAGIDDDVLADIQAREFERLKSIEVAYNKLRLSVSQKETALKAAMDQFLWYADCHESKIPKTEDTIKKAKVNRDFAKQMKEALEA